MLNPMAVGACQSFAAFLPSNLISTTPATSCISINYGFTITDVALNMFNYLYFKEKHFEPVL